MKEREKNRFKIGDKVKVADLVNIDKENFRSGFVPSMEKHCGEVCTIQRINHGGDTVDLVEDDWGFSWDARYLTKVTPNDLLTKEEQEYIKNCQGSEVTFNGLFTVDKIIAKKEDNVLVVLATDYIGKKHKIVNKCQEGDKYNVEKGIDLACIKIAERVLAKMKKEF